MLKLIKTGQKVETPITRFAVLATDKGARTRFIKNFKNNFDLKTISLPIVSKGSAKKGSSISISKAGAQQIISYRTAGPAQHKIGITSVTCCGF